MLSVINDLHIAASIWWAIITWLALLLSFKFADRYFGTAKTQTNLPMYCVKLHLQPIQLMLRYFLLVHGHVLDTSNNLKYHKYAWAAYRFTKYDIIAISMTLTYLPSKDIPSLFCILLFSLAWRMWIFDKEFTPHREQLK